MKTARLLSIMVGLLLSSFCKGQDRGELVSDSLALTLSKSEILDIYSNFGISEVFFPIDFDQLEIHKIVYYTLNGRRDGLTLASGLVTIPKDTVCDFPLMDYNHGSLMYDEAITDFKAKLDQHYIGVPFAANGYVTAIPDYLGYGATPLDHPHPYIHAKSEATAVVDMLRATRAFCDQKNIHLNGELFLLGYSQGGHTTMATHRELETLHSDEFDVTGSAPCSGPYDLSGILYDSFVYSQTFSNPFFISFGALSYQYIYQNLYSEINEMFQPPYDSLILGMLNRSDPKSYWRDSLPELGINMFQPDYLAEVLADSMHPLRQNLRDNDLYDWIPEAPVRLFYCTGDEDVPHVNAIFTAEHMAAAGADIVAYNAGPYDHFDCTPYALISAKIWFDGLRTICSVGVNDVVDAVQPKLFPNPFQDGFIVLMPGQFQGSLQLMDILGRMVYESPVNSSEQVHVPTSLPPGCYVAILEINGQTTLTRLVKN